MRTIHPVCLLALVALPLVGASSCRHKSHPEGEAPAPSSSVITLGIEIGACPDVEACERECKGGSADRCRRLATSYAFGKGVEKDETKAATLYELACEMKDPSACMFAGQMSEYARGVPADPAKAARLYTRACEMSWVGGCYNEAIMYENGRGVAKDRARAGELYQAACTAGAKVACDKAAEMRQPPPGPDLPFLDASALR